MNSRKLILVRQVLEEVFNFTESILKFNMLTDDAQGLFAVKTILLRMRLDQLDDFKPVDIGFGVENDLAARFAQFDFANPELQRL